MIQNVILILSFIGECLKVHLTLRLSILIP